MVMRCDRYDLSDDIEETPIVTHERHRRHLEVQYPYLPCYTTADLTDISLASQECRHSLNAFLGEPNLLRDPFTTRFEG